MELKKAWSILLDNLPDNAGYEGDELEEAAEYIALYHEAINTINSLIIHSKEGMS